ncbi:jg7363 [Pararge aegeria aegeria]|uniref:Jg7363 protein n=1 Tax=Pararge aegeria aegeria TaxID=348720 RepID=A0A8S4RJE9_9NEOP|nr:jg7363 [Pararge aegeria aegeria]
MAVVFPRTTRYIPLKFMPVGYECWRLKRDRGPYSNLYPDCILFTISLRVSLYAQLLMAPLCIELFQGVKPHPSRKTSSFWPLQVAVLSAYTSA